MFVFWEETELGLAEWVTSRNPLPNFIYERYKIAIGDSRVRYQFFWEENSGHRLTCLPWSESELRNACSRHSSAKWTTRVDKYYLSPLADSVLLLIGFQPFKKTRKEAHVSSSFCLLLLSSRVCTLQKSLFCNFQTSICEVGLIQRRKQQSKRSSSGVKTSPVIVQKRMHVDVNHMHARRSLNLSQFPTL